MFFCVLSSSAKLSCCFNLLCLHRDLLYVNFEVILRLKIKQLQGHTMIKRQICLLSGDCTSQSFSFPKPLLVALISSFSNPGLASTTQCIQKCLYPVSLASFHFSSFPFLRACPFVLVFDTSFLTSLLAIPLRIIYKIMMSSLSFPLFKKH